MINSIEQQLSALKGLLCMEVEDLPMAKLLKQDVRSSRFGGPQTTTDEEDAAIEDAMRVADDEKDFFIQDLIKEAGKELTDEPGN